MRNGVDRSRFVHDFLPTSLILTRRLSPETRYLERESDRQNGVVITRMEVSCRYLVSTANGKAHPP